MAADERSLAGKKFTKARMMSSGEEVKGKNATTRETRKNLFPTDFSPISLSFCIGWEVLSTFEVEEIGNENRSKKLKWDKELREMSCVESAESQIISRAIPEELVEKIVMSMSYPYILNARMLSKTWNWKFSATSPENAGFQEVVKSVSCKWPTCFPVIFNKFKGFMAGFDRSNRRWLRIFLGPLDLQGALESKSNQAPWKLAIKVSGAGCLMCGMFGDLKIFVSNVCTGSWKWLPERPRMDGSICSWIHMFLDGPDNYKVLKVTPLERQRDGCEVCAQLYESKSNSWSMKLSTVRSSPVDSGNGVYLNGVVYFTQYNIGNGMLEVWAYNVEKGSWHSIPHPLLLMIHTFRTFKLMLCQKQLIMVVRLKRGSFYDDGLERPRIRMNSLILYKLDPLTEKFTEVYRGPQEPIPGASASLYVSEGDSIYFGKLRKQSKYLMEFNMPSRSWTSFPSSSCVDPFANLVYSSFAFQPGKNPFIVV